MEPLKNIYNSSFFDEFGSFMVPINPLFDLAAFKKLIFDSEWKARALKDRMRHIAITLKEFMPSSFTESADILVLFSKNVMQAERKGFGLHYIFIPDYIELYGQDYFIESMDAMEQITTLTSCEFAVRPFIISDVKKSMTKILQWSNHKNHHVRRLASEGCRPRLPWAMAIPQLKKDPTLILPVLENLKSDSSEYVRKSVANNLNDISKDNPQTAISIFSKWKGISKETDWLIKHGSRTLLKAGNKEVLKLFGYGDYQKVGIQNFKLHQKTISIGDYLEFRFSLKNNAVQPMLIRIEYAVFYQKANKSLTSKVYKISEKEYLPNEERIVERRQSFKLISTRKFHKGLHQIALIINGQLLEKHDFELL